MDEDEDYSQLLMIGVMPRKKPKKTQASKRRRKMKKNLEIKKYMKK